MSKAFREISRQMNRALSCDWVFAACARYGELLAGGELEPRPDIGWAEIKSRVVKLINAKREELACSWQEECKHVTQMVGSGLGLNYEELVALLTSLSELAFVKTCLDSLGSTDLSLRDIPSAPELREYLIGQSSVYPPAWSLPHSIVLEGKEHWWWKKP